MKGQREGLLDWSTVSARIVGRVLELVKALEGVAQECATAAELEAQVVVMWRAGGGEVLGELMSARFGRQEGRWRECGCGGQQRFVSYRARRTTTLLGSAPVKRAYYHCEDCGGTYYVGAAELGDASGGKSLGVQEALSSLSAHVPFKEATKKLKELLGIVTCTSETEKHAEEWGERLEEEWETETEAVFEQEAEVLPEETPSRLYVALDGCKAKLLDQWREVRIGAVYDTRGQDEEGIDLAGRTTYTGLVKRWYKDFGRRLYVEAMRRGAGQAEELVVLGDGAPWIWQLAQSHFPHATHIVDWYHTTQHLWAVANAVYGKDPAAAHRWIQRQEERLRAGHVDRVIQALCGMCAVHRKHAKLLRKEARYLRRNRHRMRYDEYRRRGLHIGSGIVESACRHVSNDRLKGAGMRWTQRGAQAILNLRILYLNGRWDAYWNRQRMVA